MINDDGGGPAHPGTDGNKAARGGEVELPELAASLRRLAGQLRRTLRPANDEQWAFSLSQEAVIGILARDGARTVAQLARQERIRPQSMSTTVATLIDQGIAERRQDPADGRRQLITLADKGRALIGSSRRAREQLLADRLQDRLTARERRVLAESVALLAKIVDD
jgi:DNA-binding MarR family transcriptional regulator